MKTNRVLKTKMADMTERPTTTEALSKPSEITQQLKLFAANLETKVDVLNTQEVVAEAVSITSRNNHLAEILYGPEFGKIKQEEAEIKGKAKVGLIFCIDGRIPRLFFSFTYNLFYHWIFSL